MIDPSQSDVGRNVFYRPRTDAIAFGEISSITPDYVFVRYGRKPDTAALPARREDLHWPAVTRWAPFTLLHTARGL